MNHETEARRVRDFLDFQDRPLIEHRFVPEQSRPNVGKYKDLITREEARILSAALPEYLSEHSGPPDS